MKKLTKLNTKDAVLVITTFPKTEINPQKTQSAFSAIAWHSRKTLAQLSRTTPVIVLADKLGKKESKEKWRDLTILHIWKKGDIFSLLSLFFRIRSFSKVKNIYVQFEFNVFGGTIPNLILMFVLFLCKLIGKNITFELHQVITSVTPLKKHIHITNKFAQWYFNRGLGVYYRILGLLSENIIVFEEELKKRLSKFVSNDKIHVLSLSVDKKIPIDKIKARKILNLSQKELIILVFGFINGYKGIDWITKAMAQFPRKSNIRLLIAGGENPYLKDKAHYQLFYKSIVNNAKKLSNVAITGFVTDEKVNAYFSSADIVVLPYEVFLSASGPFSLALSYKKPLLLSRKLTNYTRSNDFSEAMKKAGISSKDIFFSFNQKKFIQKLIEIQKNKKMIEGLTLFSNILGQERSSNLVTRKMEQIIKAEKGKIENNIPSLNFQYK